MSLRRSPRQMAASWPAVATVGGREAGNAAFRAPADEQVRRDAALVQGAHHPGLHGAQGGAAGQHERGARRRPPGGRAVMVMVLIGGQPRSAGSCRAPAPR